MDDSKTKITLILFFPEQTGLDIIIFLWKIYTRLIHTPYFTTFSILELCPLISFTKKYMFT